MKLRRLQIGPTNRAYVSRCCALLLILCLVCPFAPAQNNPQLSTTELKKLSLEELTNINVTSVSKVSESLGGAAAAVAVVTNEDIRRSGATSIPDALRLVPGLHVARQTSDL